jgi:hypothetical protein
MTEPTPLTAEAEQELRRQTELADMHERERPYVLPWVVMSLFATLDALRTQLEQAQRQKTFPHTTPTGHTYHEPTDWKQLCEWSMNRAQGSIECWDDAELPPDETPAMFTIAWNTAVRAREALESAEKALWHHHETMGLETDPEHSRYLE